APSDLCRSSTQMRAPIASAGWKVPVRLFDRRRQLAGDAGRAGERGEGRKGQDGPMPSCSLARLPASIPLNPPFLFGLLRAAPPSPRPARSALPFFGFKKENDPQTVA